MKLDEIKELARIFGKSKLDKMKIKMKDFELEMEKGGEVKTVAAPATPTSSAVVPAAPVAPAIPVESTPAAPVASVISGDTITSPMVGTYYASPSPDSPPFVKAGDKVKKGQTLCILEAMKIMNEIEAGYDCKIIEVLVEDGEAVEYDKPIFVIEKL
jgi:acetyl-CoA carboxylase biotin carboxyl carrier protein